MKNKKTLEYYLNLPYRLEIIPDKNEGGYTAWYPELPGCLTCAESLEEIVLSAQDAKRAWIEAAIEDGVDIVEPAGAQDISSYSGQFRLRMPKSLHMTLALHARQEGISMNQYCNYLLTINDSTYNGTKVV